MERNIYESIKEKIDISKEDFESFLSLTKEVTIKKNDYFINEGSAAKYVAFVKSGILYSYTVDKKGDKHVVQIAMKNHWISDLFSFFSNEVSLFNIQAIEDSEIILLSKNNFELLFRTTPVFERYFRILIQNAYVDSLRKISRIYGDSAKERYQNLATSNPEIIKSVPQHYIASYLGIKPQSLSRIKKMLH